jgi:hypothetical protein
MDGQFRLDLNEERPLLLGHGPGIYMSGAADGEPTQAREARRPQPVMDEAGKAAADAAFRKLIAIRERDSPSGEGG